MKSTPKPSRRAGIPWIAKPSLHWLELSHLLSPTPVHSATKKPQATTVDQISITPCMTADTQRTHLVDSRDPGPLIGL